MTTIWKFPLLREDHPIIDMPENAMVLSVMVQKGLPYIWAWVNPEAPMKPRHFRLLRTGQPIIPGEMSRYVSSFSFQVDENSHVFHLFEAGT